MNEVTGLTTFDLAMFTLAAIASVGLLVTLAWSRLTCKQQEEPLPHNPDDAGYKRGV